jgi:phage gp16-like protein
MLAKVHLAAKELGLDEDARRDVLERVTGRRSAGDCRDDQLDAVLAEFKRLGWTPKSSAKARTGTAPISGRRPATHPVALKARAMWISLWNLGVVRSSTEASLEAFAKRQLRVDRLQWADQGQGYRLIEALKAMAERAGWSQDLTLIKPARHVWTLKARLHNAQLRALAEPAAQLQGVTEAQLDEMIAAAGVRLRAATGGEGGAA